MPWPPFNWGGRFRSQRFCTAEGRQGQSQTLARAPVNFDLQELIKPVWRKTISFRQQIAVDPDGSRNLSKHAVKEAM